MSTPFDLNTPWKKAAFFALIFLLGMLVYFVGGYWSAPSREVRLVIRIVLVIFFLLLARYLRRSPVYNQYWKLAFAFCTASGAFLAASLFARWLAWALNATEDSLSGIALLKFIDAFLIVVTILLVNALSGDDADSIQQAIPYGSAWKWLLSHARQNSGSIYVQHGNLLLSLSVGLVAFLIFAGVFYLQAQGQGLQLVQLLPMLPWVLLFVLSNGLMEELHFRGLLLRRLEPFLGPFLSNLVIAIFFTLMHITAGYTTQMALFLGLLFFLSLAWGYLMQKSNNLWGAALFHAGADLLVILGVVQMYAH